MRVAVIDVGFNSLKMVKYKVDPDGHAKPYGQLGLMARLGEGLENTGYLGNEPISRTIDALRLCLETATLESIDHLILVGTSPVREAANREEFLERVRKGTGLEMRVLTGNEEALYGLLGSLGAIDGEEVLFFDLGGGSLEMTYADRHQVKEILSLPLGALKLTSMFAAKDGRYTKKARSRMAKHITHLLPSRKELGLAKNTVLLGTGGSVRAMARYDQDEADYPFDKVHNYQIRYGAVQRMSRRFFRMSVAELDGVDAIGEGRSETIAAGAQVVRTVMKKLVFGGVTVSTHGLRDGILTEFLEGRSPMEGGLRGREDLERVIERRGTPEGFGDELDLLQCMKRNGLVDERESKILRLAARRGLSPESSAADADAVFGILMSEDLPLSHEDQLLLSLAVVRARRPRTANWLSKKYAKVLGRDAKMLKKLGSCVRLMEVLNLSKAQFRVAYSGGLRISVIGSERPFPLELARTAAFGLSGAIRKPVTVFVSAKERERHVGLVKVGR